MQQSNQTNGKLFALPVAEPEQVEAEVTGSALGAVAETLLIAGLLERGHKVAVPVVDDDGVDLIVNYGTTVQVKSTAFRHQGGNIRVELDRPRYRGGEQRGRRTLKSHVDVLAVFERDERVWWFITREQINGRKRMYFGETTSLRSCREAWDVFDVCA